MNKKEELLEEVFYLMYKNIHTWKHNNIVNVGYHLRTLQLAINNKEQPLKKEELIFMIKDLGGK